jgi:hypothetical protein
MSSAVFKEVQDDVRDYLCLIQNAIDRMSSTSAIIKGFAATVITGIAALSLTSIDKWILLLSFLPVVSFFALDVYYLRIERKYRYLYEQVRTQHHVADFDLKIDNKNKDDNRAANATLLKCLASGSIYLFYLPVVIIITTICILKFCGYIC